MENKKMRNTAIAIALLLLLCSIFFGCNGGLEVLVIGGYEGDFVTAMTNYPLWTRDSSLLKSENAPAETMEIEFEGQKYKGTFSSSCVNMYENYRTDHYTYDGGSFDVNANTGELAYINLGINVRTGKVLSDDDRREIAFRVADKYIDREKYKLKTVENDMVCHYAFIKYVNGIYTYEELCVGVSKYGEVVTFETSMLGAYPDDIEALPFATQEQMKLLKSDGTKEKVLEQVKASTKNSQDLTFSVVGDGSWVLLENGACGMVYGVQIERPPSRMDEWHDRYELVTVLVK